jgi:D-alanine transaminase
MTQLMRVNHVIFALEDHIERFYRSCSKLKIPFSMSKEELAKTLQDLVDQVDDSESLMVYWQATRGTGMRNHVFPEGPAKSADYDPPRSSDSH